MSPLLDQARMYRAVVERDESFVGVFFVGVKSTGVFCRPGCPARAPNAENCEFFPMATSAMQAGYRPCRRCAPLKAFSDMPAWAVSLLDRIESEPDRPVTASEIRAAKVDPATASRYFKSRLGATLPAIARARRVGLALKWIRQGDPVARVALRSGFRSESGFRKAVTELFGAPPGDAAKSGAEPIVAKWLDTPVGPMLGAATERGVCMLEFVDRRGLAAQLQSMRRRLQRPLVPGDSKHLRQLQTELAAYFGDAKSPFRVQLDAPGTPFQTQVWDALRTIPTGQTRSYADIARAIGRASAVRAVARANGDNRIAIIIPCHRVIGSDGSLTGYGGGLWRKHRLLEHEGVPARGTAAYKQPTMFDL